MCLQLLMQWETIFWILFHSCFFLIIIVGGTTFKLLVFFCLFTLCTYSSQGMIWKITQPCFHIEYMRITMRSSPQRLAGEKKSISYNHRTTIWSFHEYYLNHEFHKILWRAFWVIVILRFSPYVARLQSRFQGLDL